MKFFVEMRFLQLCWLLFGTLCAQTTLAAGPSDPGLLGVGEVRWGFDGTIGHRLFMPVSIEVHNQSALPWEGTLTLSKSIGRGLAADAPLESPLMLQGNESRWVQFTPYLLDESETWTLHWGPDPTHSAPLPALRRGDRATVLVYDPGEVALPEGSLKRMPEDLFPQSVTSCAGLRGVVLQHAPFWQGARAQAFLEWLRGGGRVYLLRNDRGAYPAFPGSLDVLNRPDARYRVGNGVVRRLEFSTADLDPVTVRREILLDDSPVDRGLRQEKRPNLQTAASVNRLWDADDKIFSKLQNLIAFKRRWWLIYACVAAYIFALFPGCYWIGRTRRNVRGFYLAFAGVTALFSVVFILLSRLDNTSTNRIATVSVAREVGPGVLDLTEWSMWRVAHESRCSASHPGSGHCYSVGQDLQAVKGVMHPGLIGNVTFDLPPASMRSLLHKSRIANPLPSPQVLELVAEAGRIDRLRVSFAGSFESKPLSACALYEGNMWQLDLDGQEFHLPPRPQPVVVSYFLDQTFFSMPQFQLTLGGVRGRSLEEEPEGSKVFEEIFPHLMASALGVTDTLSHNVLTQQREDVRLAILVPQPAEQRTVSEDFADQTGAVLYLFNLSSPAGTQP